MMWNDFLIRRAVNDFSHPIAYIPEERAAFEGIKDPQFQPASLDVRLGPDFIIHPGGQKFLGINEFELLPGGCVLAMLLERVQIPNDVVARIEGKSTWARQFLTVHSAGFIDPGFHGDVTLELKNDGEVPIYLFPGVAIAQMSFQYLSARAIRPYGTKALNSHYQSQEGVNGAISGADAGRSGPWELR